MIPNQIYRFYTAEYGIGVLRHLEIRTSIPSALNDPFELSPNIDAAKFTQKQCEAVLRQAHFIDDAYQREGLSRRFRNRKKFERWYLKNLRERAARLLPKVPRNVESVRQNFANMFSKYWRLVCASHVYDSVLMWSHYAANHTGLVIGFNTAQLPFSQIGEDCWLTVVYSPKKPEYLYDINERTFRKNMFAVAGTKAAEWSYEKEVRIVLATTAIREERFLPLTAESIAGIYYGCRISQSDKNAFEEMLGQPHFRHIERRQAVLSDYEYRLRFD
jgi:hypothetical protein